MTNRNSWKLVFSALVLATSFWCLAPVVSAQKSKSDEIRKKIEDLERRRASKDKEVAEAEKALERRRDALAKDFEKTFSQEFLDGVAGLLSSVVTQAKTGGTVADSATRSDELFKELEKDIRPRFAPLLFDQAKGDLIACIKSLLDEPEETSIVRASRYLKDHLENAFRSTSFDDSWAKVFRSRLSVEVDGLKEQAAELARTIENLRSQLTSGISGNIPRNMVPVPGAQDITLGLDAKEVDELVRVRDEKLAMIHFANTGKEKKTIEPFLMEQYEVTQLAYWYFCQETGRKGPTDTKGVPLWPEGKVPEGWEKRPVTCVSREDAEEYAAWVRLRLPFEDEWELAARSGKNGYDGRLWAWGNEYKELRCNDDRATGFPARRAIGMTVAIPEQKVNGVVNKVDVAGTTPVGSFPDGASPLGIFDLNGNAAEWTMSPFAPRGTFKEVVREKQKYAAYDFDREKAVVRGGSFNHNSLFVASFARNSLEPLARHKAIGFRCVRSAIPGKDFQDNLIGGARLDARLTDFPKKTRAETAANRVFPEIDRTPGRYAIVEHLAWNEELDVRGKATALFIANRKCDEIGSEGDLKDLAKGEKDLPDSFLLGIFHTDVDLVKPALKAGTYFLAYKTGYKIKPEDKKEPPIIVKDSILIVPEKTGGEIIRWEDISSAVLVSKGNLKSTIEVLSNTDDSKEGNDKATLVYCYGIRGRDNNTLQVILNFEAAKGTLKGFE